MTTGEHSLPIVAELAASHLRLAEKLYFRQFVHVPRHVKITARSVGDEETSRRVHVGFGPDEMTISLAPDEAHELSVEIQEALDRAGHPSRGRGANGCGGRCGGCAACSSSLATSPDGGSS